MMRLHYEHKGFVLTLFILCFFFKAHAQVSISGSVIDDSGPIPGVNIIEKGTSNGTISDIGGNFKLDVSNQEAVLTISAIGYVKQEIKVGSQSQINVTLKEDVVSLQEIVVVGYGGVTKKELTGSVTSVKSEEILKTATNDLNSALQGQMSGVSVQSSNGSPGAQANIQIRGINSFSASSVNPLYVIDGVPFFGVPNITPEEIESIDVSKDGATAAIYGTRASNGVIQITTKKGKSGKLQVGYSGYYGVQNITSGIELLNTEEQIFVENQRAINQGGIGGSTLVVNPDALERDNDLPGFTVNDDAPITNHTLTISAGNDIASLFAVVNYFNQDGTLKNSDYEATTLRINGNLKKGKFSAFSSLSVKLDDRRLSPFGIYERSLVLKPWSQLPGGENEFQVTENPQFTGVFAQEFSDRDERTTNTTNANVTLKYEFIPGLELQLTGGASIFNFRRRLWQPQFFILDKDGELNEQASRFDARLRQEWRYSLNYTAQSVLQYKKSFGSHNFSAQTGYTVETNNRFEEIGTSSDFLSNDTQVFNAANPENATLNGQEFDWALRGILGRISYNYAERYLVSASIRNDKSSNFSASRRSDWFWGASAGWNIAEEAFFGGAKSYIENFKLRASLASVGNQSILPYLFNTTVFAGSNYHFGAEGSEDVQTGATQRTYANDQVQWEANISRNIGIDISAFDGRLTLITDVYQNSKSKMLVPVRTTPSAGSQIPRAENGFGNITQNVGNMVNKGVEVELKYQGRVSDLEWSAQGVFTKNVNEVTDLPDTQGNLSLGGGNPILAVAPSSPVSFLVLNNSVPTFMLVPTDGIIKTEEELEEYNAQFSENTGAKVGDLRYINANGDSLLNDEDRIPMGSPLPDFELGLNLNASYKGVDLTVQMFYSHGGKIYNATKAVAYQIGRHKDLIYQWAPSNPDGNIPAQRQGNSHSNFDEITDLYLEDATYFRIRNVTLGYSLPKSWLEKAHLSKFRTYVSLQNILTLTNYTGFDPEVGYSAESNNGSGDALFSRGVDRGTYPVSRRFLLGVQINF